MLESVVINFYYWFDSVVIMQISFSVDSIPSSLLKLNKLLIKPRE